MADKRVTIRVSDEHSSMLEKMAADKGVSISDVIRDLVQNHNAPTPQKEEPKGVEPLNTEDIAKLVAWFQKTEAKINLINKKVDDMVFAIAVMIAQNHASGNVIKEKREDIFNRLSNIVKNVK